MPICKLCNNNFSTYVVINGQKKNLGSRKYCLQCSPFGFKNTRTLSTKDQEFRSCDICNKNLTSKLRQRCDSCNSRIHRARLKLACVKYLGGKCMKCGWNEDYYVLEFHHKNNNKEFQISDKILSWEKMKQEIQKCELLCSNCHRSIHSKRNEINFHKAVMDYKGNLDIIINN